MNGFSFRYGPEVLSGPGTATGLAALLPPGPLLFVTDTQVRALGLIDPVLESLGGREITIFDALQRMSIAAGMPQRLREVGVETGDLDHLARDAMLQTRLLRNNPCPIVEADARRLHEAAL